MDFETAEEKAKEYIDKYLRWIYAFLDEKQAKFAEQEFINCFCAGWKGCFANEIKLLRGEER